MTGPPPADAAAWIAQQEGCAGDAAKTCLQRVAAGLAEVAARHVVEVGGGDASSPEQLAPYAQRVWVCLEYHWKRLAEKQPVPFAEAVERIESGRLSYGSVGGNVLLEVALAVGLEAGSQQAAARFESDYMPVVRAVAARRGGERAVEAVDNFAAELMLPRGDRPPRIALFTGKTPLSFWLRAVVTNYWLSRVRKAEPQSLPPPLAAPPEAPPENRQCEGLLEPVFQQAVGELADEDRLILQMLILDGVPQKEMARVLNLHSGTLTRRRQNAQKQLWANVQKQIAAGAGQAQARECLDTVLTGNDVELQRALADALAQAVRSQDEEREPS